jgi:hypothetical protein
MTLPWEIPSIYNRTITITRPNVQAAVGSEGYGGVNAATGLNPASETTVATGLPASIQLASSMAKPLADLPSDIYNRTGWKIFIPASSAALGLINDRDIVTDDQSQRYQVTANNWDILGYTLMCERLEA